MYAYVHACDDLYGVYIYIYIHSTHSIMFQTNFAFLYSHVDPVAWLRTHRPSKWNFQEEAHGMQMKSDVEPVEPSWKWIRPVRPIPSAESEAEGSSFHVAAQGETNSFATIIPPSHSGADHLWCFFESLRIQSPSDESVIGTPNHHVTMVLDP